MKTRKEITNKMHRHIVACGLWNARKIIADLKNGVINKPNCRWLITSFSTNDFVLNSLVFDLNTMQPFSVAFYQWEKKKTKWVEIIL